MKKFLQPLIASFFILHSFTSFGQDHEIYKETQSQNDLNTGINFSCQPIKNPSNKRITYILGDKSSLRFFVVSHTQNSIPSATTNSIKQNEEDSRAIFFVVENEKKDQKRSGIILKDLSKIHDKSIQLAVDYSIRLDVKYFDFIALQGSVSFDNAVEVLHSIPVASLTNFDTLNNSFQDIYYLDSTTHDELIKACLQKQE